jgi:hypothetical protein
MSKFIYDKNNSIINDAIVNDTSLNDNISNIKKKIINIKKKIVDREKKIKLISDNKENKEMREMKERENVFIQYTWYPLENYFLNYNKEYISEYMISERLTVFKKYPLLTSFIDYPTDIFNLNRYSIEFENKYPEYKFIPAIPN